MLECDGLEQTIHETYAPSNCLTARIYGTPKLVLLTVRNSSDQSLIICSTTCSSDFCCSIVFNIPFKSSIRFRSACRLLKIFLTGMRFCSSPLEPSPSLSPLSDEDVCVFFPDVIKKYTKNDFKILREWHGYKTWTRRTHDDIEHTIKQLNMDTYITSYVNRTNKCTPLTGLQTAKKTCLVC